MQPRQPTPPTESAPARKTGNITLHRALHPRTSTIFPPPRSHTNNGTDDGEAVAKTGIKQRKPAITGRKKAQKTGLQTGTPKGPKPETNTGPAARPSSPNQPPATNNPAVRSETAHEQPSGKNQPPPPSPAPNQRSHTPDRPLSLCSTYSYPIKPVSNSCSGSS